MIGIGVYGRGGISAKWPRTNEAAFVEAVGSDCKGRSEQLLVTDSWLVSSLFFCFFFMVSLPEGHGQQIYDNQRMMPAMGVSGAHDPGNNDQAQDQGDELTTFFCKALYDYQAQDSSALSFSQGDVIEVLTQQPSGWWDGLLGEERGWFPSNYVTILTDEEAEQMLAGSEQPGAESSTAGPDTEQAPVDMSHALMSGHQSENEDWLDRDVSQQRSAPKPDVSRSRSNTGPPPPSKSQPEDYWMPEVTPDNQVRARIPCVPVLGGGGS